MIRAFFLCLFVGFALAIYTIWIEPRQLRIRHVELGEGMNSVRLVIASDWHMGGYHAPPERIASVVEAINAQRADIVLMPGDFISGSEPRQAVEAEKLERIRLGLAELSELDGAVFATIGNHDTWFDPVTVRTDLERYGVTVLDNENVSFDDLCVVGLADSDTAFPSPIAYNGCDPADALIVMMHSPDARFLLRSDTIFAVAGHTHGGQVKLPIFGRAVTSTQCGRPCAYGLIQNAPPLWVTSGIGTSILPVSFRAPPEIVVVTLNYGATQS